MKIVIKFRLPYRVVVSLKLLRKLANIVLVCYVTMCCVVKGVSGQSYQDHNESKTNVILIMADDLGYECLGSNGGLSYKTPNLDRLANDGLRFTNCYSQPLCSPSRVKIMTGLRNFRNYEHFGYLNPDQKTFGTLMKEAGYNTCIAGKWQLNGISGGLYVPGWDDSRRPSYFGFDKYCLWQVTKDVYPDHGIKRERYADPFIEENGKVIGIMEDKYGPDIFCDFILDFITKNKSEPFFVYYPMVLTHAPFTPTPDSKEWANKELRFKNDTSYFSAMVQYMDKIVGRMISRVKELGIEKNTIIIFTGDNGTDTRIISSTQDGEIWGGKGTMTDAGTHVPLIISWPAQIKKPGVLSDLIEFSDFYSLLAELTHQKGTTDGKSFLKILVDEKNYVPRKSLMVHYDPKWGNMNKNRGRFVRNKEYKLYQDGRFYNVKKDPLEKNPIGSGHFTKNELKIRMQLQLEQKSAPGWEYFNGRDSLHIR